MCTFLSLQARSLSILIKLASSDFSLTSRQLHFSRSCQHIFRYLKHRSLGDRWVIRRISRDRLIIRFYPCSATRIKRTVNNAQRHTSNAHNDCSQSYRHSYRYHECAVACISQYVDICVPHLVRAFMSLCEHDGSRTHASMRRCPTTSSLR